MVSARSRDKALVNLSRRAARRRGLRLMKSHRRDDWASDYNRFMLVDEESGEKVFGADRSDFTATLEQIDDYLSTQPVIKRILPGLPPAEMTAEQEALAQRLKLWIDGRALSSAAPWLRITTPTLRKIMRSEPVAQVTVAKLNAAMDAFTGDEALKPKKRQRIGTPAERARACRARRRGGVPTRKPSTDPKAVKHRLYMRDYRARKNAGMESKVA